MGTGQNQAIRPVRTTIRTKVQLSDEQKQEQKQSLELCQTLITSAIGCIAYIRGLLPEHSFETINYNSRAGTVTDKLLDQDRAGGTHLKVLKRGDSTQADRVLDWIEYGIFDALEKGFLQAFQFVVFLEVDRPEIVYEAYTFSINYQTLLDGTILGVDGMSVGNITSFGKETNEQYDFSLPESRKTLQIIMRRLIAMTQNLDALPEVKYLTVRLYHTKNTPADYSPPMFESSSGKNLKFLETLKTSVGSYNFGKLDTGLHSMNVNVATSEKRADPTEVDHMSYKRSRLHYVRADKLIIESSLDRSCSGTISSACESTNEATLGTLPTNNIGQVMNAARVQHHSKGNSQSVYNGQEHSDASNKPYQINRVQKEVALLQGMNATQRQSTDIIPTQEIVHRERVLSYTMAPVSLAPFTERTVVETSKSKHLTQPDISVVSNEFTRSQNNIKCPSTHKVVADSSFKYPEGQTSNNITILHTQNEVALNDRAELNELKLQELKLHQRRISKGNNAKSPGDGDELIRCECGVKKEIGEMVCCFVCNAWQHLHCYGYYDKEDTRLPRDHACYSCLLSENEPKLLNTMANLAFLRHGIHMIDKSRAKTFSTDQNISEKLGCDVKRVIYMREFLIKEGFLHKASYTEASTRTRTSKARAEVYKIVRSDESKEKTRTMFFNPLLNIEHHYSLPETVRHEMPLDDDPHQNINIHESLIEKSSLLEPISRSLSLSKLPFVLATCQSSPYVSGSNLSTSGYKSFVLESKEYNIYEGNLGHDVWDNCIGKSSGQVDGRLSMDKPTTHDPMHRTSEHTEAEESLATVTDEEDNDNASVSETQYNSVPRSQWRMSDVRDPIHTSVDI